MSSTSLRKENTPLDRLTLRVPCANKSNVARWSRTGGRDRRCRGNTSFISLRNNPAARKQATASRDVSHPVHDGLDSASRPEDRRQRLLDPFLGIGILRGCGETVLLDPHFIGFEIDEEYLRGAQRRLREGITANACLTPAILKKTSPAV